MTSARRSHTTLSFSRAVPELLAERGWTQRDLARAVDVDPAHICRLLRRTLASVSPALLVRVAAALCVPPDFFVEHRRHMVIEAVRSSPALCERLYHSLAVDSEPVSDDSAPSFAPAAILAARDRPEPPPPANPRFSREEIIAAILRWNDRYGEPPALADWAQLAAAEAPCGPGVLSSRVRAVSEARASHDATALRGALIDLAAAALSWADAAGSVAPVPLARRSAA